MDIQGGDGWGTNGMLGGTGYNIYASDMSKVGQLANECRKFVAACARLGPNQFSRGDLN